MVCHSCSQTPFPNAGYGREPDERRLVMNVDRLYYGLAGVGIPPLLALLPSHVYTKQYAYMHTKIRTPPKHQGDILIQNGTRKRQ
jgi:hypothetical protein